MICVIYLKKRKKKKLLVSLGELWTYYIIVELHEVL